MREKCVEQRLFHAVRKQGGIALKLVSPSYAGLPDRIVLLPGGHIAFVEVKAPGKRPRPLQLMRIGFLKQLGFRTCVLDDPAMIPELIAEIQEPAERKEDP